MEKLSTLLKRYGFYYSVEELEAIKKNKDSIELTKKAYGDSKEYETAEYFGDDYPKLKTLCEELGMMVDGYIWLD